MAREELIRLPSSEWVELTNAAVDSVAFQSQSGPIFVRATSGTAPPSGDVLGYQFKAFDPIELELATAFPGVSGANRLWAYSPNIFGKVYVCHG